MSAAETPIDLARVRATLARLRALAALQGGVDACRVVEDELRREDAHSGREGHAKVKP